MQKLINIPENSEFSLHNFPYAVFHLKEEDSSLARGCTRLGDTVIDLSVLVEKNLLSLNNTTNVFKVPHLNDFIALGKEQWHSVRE